MQKRINTENSRNGYRFTITVNGEEYSRTDDQNTDRDGDAYTDIPLKPRADGAPLPPEETVSRFRSMRRLSFSRSIRTGAEDELFYRQALLMADYSDDFEYTGDILRYCPTYQSLSDEQLRGYFGWRTKVRSGDIRKTTLAYVFLYLYELLCRIGPGGVLPPEEAFRQIGAFVGAYEVHEPSIQRYTDNWLVDFAAYYSLPQEWLNNNPQSVYDRHLITLLHNSECSDESLFESITALSAYEAERSTLYKDAPDAFRYVACGVFRDMEKAYSSAHQKSYIDSLFGVPVECPVTLFRSAVVFSPDRHEDSVYTLNEIHRYTCSDNRWFCEKYYGNRSKSKALGDLVKSVDSRLRSRLGLGSPLKQELTARQVTKCIDAQTDLYLLKKRREDALRIEIDVSQLPGIRRSADITRDRLITDEEKDIPFAENQKACTTTDPAVAGHGIHRPADVSGDEPERRSGTDTPVKEPKVLGKADASEKKPEICGSTSDASANGQVPGGFASASGSGPSEVPEQFSLLSDHERQLLLCLLEGKSCMDALRGSGLIASVVADSINEKLFDVFSDVVIDADGDNLTLVEDYIPDLKTYL